jgi:hypothetical protein
MDKLFLILLGIFLLLYGFAHATNIQIIWMAPLTAIAALAAGIVALIRALR